MNVYDSILSFHGTWRTYQARVLESAQRYLDDKKIHRNRAIKPLLFILKKINLLITTFIRP